MMKAGETSNRQLFELDVVIVNFNAGPALRDCVESVLQQSTDSRITVIDNASEDGSLQLLDGLAGPGHQLRLIQNHSNRGFAHAVNQGATLAGERSAGRAQHYLLILNPDCVLHQDCLASLCQAMADNPQAALAAPRVLDTAGHTARGTYRRFPRPWNSLVSLLGLYRLGSFSRHFKGVELSESLPEQTVSAEAVSGACMLVDFNCFLQLGGLDEAYGLHCEDLDLMFRLQQEALEVLLVPFAQVTHQQGVSSRSRPFWVHRQKHAGMQRFFNKFQARQHNLLVRALVSGGIWLHYLVTLPMVAWRR